MLWRIMCNNFEFVLHNACAFKEMPKHFLQCIFAFSIFSLHYTDGCIWSIINDCTTIIFFWKLTVIVKCVFCELFQNFCINSTGAYIKTVIHFQEDSKGTHFSLFQCLMQVQWSSHIIHIKQFPSRLFVYPSPLYVYSVYTIPISQIVPLVSGQH